MGWPPIEVFIGSVDVFHASDWVHPPRRRGATVTTVHDVGALAHPEWYAPDVMDSIGGRIKLQRTKPLPS